MFRAWRTPPLARARAQARARIAWGWARSAASESQQPAVEQDSPYRDTVLLPRSRFPAQLPGLLQPETELETQQVAAGQRLGAPGAAPGGERGGSALGRREGGWLRLLYGPGFAAIKL